jgi:hypothetical protein
VAINGEHRVKCTPPKPKQRDKEKPSSQAVGERQRKPSKKKGGRVMVTLSKKKDKGDGTRTYWLSRWTCVLSFFTSVGMMIGGFFTPPLGVIDGSVITAVGELLLFPTLLYLYRAVELGYKFKFSKGDTSVELHKKEAE